MPPSIPQINRSIVVVGRCEPNSIAKRCKQEDVGPRKGCAIGKQTISFLKRGFLCNCKVYTYAFNIKPILLCTVFKKVTKKLKLSATSLAKKQLKHERKKPSEWNDDLCSQHHYPLPPLSSRDSRHFYEANYTLMLMPLLQSGVNKLNEICRNRTQCATVSVLN